MRRTRAARRETSGIDQPAERILPWLSAAVFAATCYMAGLTWGLPMSVNQGAALLTVLAGTLASAGLLAARSARAQDATQLEERARPASDELAGMTNGDPFAETGAPVYLKGMEQWATALLDLFDYAGGASEDPAVVAALTDAAEDTRALRDLLADGASHHLSLNEAAMLHSVAMMWETDQERLEQLAASVDPAWHRRWQARSIVDRQFRHGRAHADHLVLPYR